MPSVSTLLQILQRRTLTMAWTSHGRNNNDLIDNMNRNGLLKSDRVIEAMKKVDRANYVRLKSDAYYDAPSHIEFGATISAPHMHAHDAENLLPLCKPGAKILDVGSGSGYTCAVFHHLVEDGTVIGIDHIPELVHFSVQNLRNDGLGAQIDSDRIKMVVGDGRQGYPESGPYNVIHVGASAPALPHALVDQLARPGRMFIPVGDGEQYIWQVDKDEHGTVKKTKLFGVRYVPLTDRQSQQPYL